MPRSTSNRSARARDNGTTLGFEAKLWQAADALRNNMDAAEYKHVVLGLIFLKYISEAFAAEHAELDAQRSEGGRSGRSGCRRERNPGGTIAIRCMARDRTPRSLARSRGGQSRASENEHSQGRAGRVQHQGKRL